MSIFDLLQRMTNNQQQQPSGPVNAPTPTAATVAAPTMQQTQQQDFNNAMLGRMGQLGMMLVAAGQRMTPRDRATILAQAPQYMDGVQTDMANAAQARLMATRAQQEQIDQARQAAIDAKLSDPKFLTGLGIKPEMAEALGPAGVRKLLENQALANTPDALLDRQYKQAQINHLNTPTKGTDPYADTLAREKAQFDARKAQAETLGLKGEDAQQYAATGKMQTANEKQTQDQANAALFSARMEEANKVLSNPDISKFGMGIPGVMNKANSMIPIIGNAFLDPQYQQLDQAKRDFVNAVLRRESGAAISNGEFGNAEKQYFPQVGDSPEVMAQKAQNRATAIQGIYDAAAPQYRRGHQVDTTGGRASPFKEYPNARQAPDGHWYVQQEGKTYRVDR
jgi:hypothetical protein